jgi:BlaI family penicillinase repressor
MADSLQISPAEWDVMAAVWESGSTTAAEVIACLGESHDWSHRTIRTLLARLVEKGALKYTADGKAYIYRPAVTREQCVRQEGRTFMNKVFGGDVGALLVHFVEDAQLSPDKIEKLRQLLATKKDPRRRKSP